MLSTWTFLLFVIASLALYWLLVPTKARSVYLAIISFAYFYGLFPDQRQGLLFILVLAVLVYISGMIIRKHQDKTRAVMISGIVVLVGILAYFKYAAFLADTLNIALIPLLKYKLTVPKVFIPIGISYFIFKMIHYVVDSFKGKIEEHSPADFLNYIFFFPILISGPIERFQPFLANLKAGDRFSMENIYAGLPRIASGLFKKVVLADTLGATAAMMQQPNLTAEQYWLASFAYTLQLYFDFAGYSDMAIGISRLFGFTIMENFDWPYLAQNVSDFWKRWHRSLTGWFRDYLFIPIGGSRGGLGLVIRNTLIVMAVTGLWHGAGWHFVFWGLYHAVGLIALRLYRKFLLPSFKCRTSFFDSKLSAVISTLITFNFVNIGWIFFACDANQSIYVLTHMF
ncbi:MAG: MBOAT family O-acyltransferase [Candidatus Saccharibacteria bacterium]